MSTKRPKPSYAVPPEIVVVQSRGARKLRSHWSPPDGEGPLPDSDRVARLARAGFRDGCSLPKRGRRRERRGKSDRLPPELVRRRMLELEKWVYLEQEVAFSIPEVVEDHQDAKIVQLKSIQRAVGSMQATLVEISKQNPRQGMLKVDDVLLPCVDVRLPRHRAEVPFEGFLDSIQTLYFWPTWDFCLSLQTFSADTPVHFKRLKIASIVGPSESSSASRIQAIGKLKLLSPHHFAIRLFSQCLKRYFFVYFVGAYPYPDEEGEYVWVEGTLDPGGRFFVLDCVESLAFLSDDEVDALPALR